MEKDLSLLRPFDRQAALNGYLLCSKRNDEPAEYRYGPDVEGRVCVERDGKIVVWYCDFIRMAPLCWVEGKPVYKGDVLYVRISTGERLKVEAVSWNKEREGLKVRHLDDARLGLCTDSVEDLTWTAHEQKNPKTGWIVCTRNMGALSEEEAKSIAASHPELLALHVNWEA